MKSLLVLLMTLVFAVGSTGIGLALESVAAVDNSASISADKPSSMDAKAEKKNKHSKTKKKKRSKSSSKNKK